MPVPLTEKTKEEPFVSMRNIANMKAKLFLCGLLTLMIPAVLFAEPPQGTKSSALKNAVILIIRHAEKPDAGYGLSADGEVRARAYVNYFKTFAVDGQPLKLNYLFAAADSKESHRSRLTIEPTSKALGLHVDTRFADAQTSEIAREIQNKAHGKAILIAWHHGEIPVLLDALGADAKKVLPKGKWPGDVFGWVIQLRYDENGNLGDVKRINEKLMPDDSNNHTAP